MSRIPSIEDWKNDPAGSLAAASELAKATSANGDASTQAIAMGIAAKVLAQAAPIVGQAIAGPLGAIAGAAVMEVAESMASQNANALSTFTAGQRAMIDVAVQTATAAAAEKLK